MKLSFNFHLKGDLDLGQIIMYAASVVTLLEFFI
jgi:hypothetical protein